MKKLQLLMISLVLCGTVWAQAPQSFKYQGVARNSEGVAITNSPIGLQFSILAGSATGTTVYSETFTATSSGSGVFSVNIGEGNVVSGNFSDIDWGGNTYFLKVAMDISGGSDYVDMGTSQLLSVPYSLYTGSIYVNYSNDTLYIGDQYVIIFGGGGGGGGGNTVTDYDGNTYETVTIGNQTWLKQNLRSLHYADGTPIDSVWVYDDNESNAEVYGRLYSWDAAMNGASSSNGNPSGVQGACPDGWHMPSQAEFEELINAVGGTSSGGCALKSSNSAYWETSSNPGTNSSGFSARGAGKREPHQYQYENLKRNATFWCTTEDAGNSFLANHLNLMYQYCMVQINSLLGEKDTGYSIRCVKDE